MGIYPTGLERHRIFWSLPLRGGTTRTREVGRGKRLQADEILSIEVTVKYRSNGKDYGCTGGSAVNDINW